MLKILNGNFFGNFVNRNTKILLSKNPWGEPSGNNSGDSNKDKKPKENPKILNPNFGRKNRETNFDDLIKKGEDFFKKNFGKNGGGSNKNNWQKKFEDKTPKSIIGLFILGFVLLWLMTGIYKVDSDENAAVLYFGKFYSISTPGLNYHIPYPFGQIIKKSVTTINSEEFGFSSNSRKLDKRNFDAESLMLTGDENIVDVEFQIQWQIYDIKNFVFNIANPNLTIRKSAEGAMREIIARTPIANALSDGKAKIEQETKSLLQETLDSYGAGVRIVLVQLRRVDPPAQVIDAFRDVQTAKADKEKEINQAQSYANDIIPRARGTASQTKEQSEAYSKEVVTNAQGEAGRFSSVYNQYSNSKQVTKTRLYLETMEKIYRDADKIFIDKNSSKSGVLPYFSLNEINQVKQKAE
jgi:membrane protease subunit HflK